MASQNPRYDPSRQGKNKRKTPATTVAERHPAFRPDPALRSDPFAVLESMGGPSIDLDDLHPAIVPLPRQSTGVLVADEGTLIDVDEAKWARRDTHVPTDISRAQVQVLSAVGTPKKMICMQMGVTMGTLDKHYPHELMVAKSVIHAMAAQTVLRIMATAEPKEQLKAAQFILQTQSGWRITERVEVARGSDEIPENAGAEKLQDMAAAILERARQRRLLNEDVTDVDVSDGDS